MEENLSYEYLESLCLTDLRELARKIGVKNPTSKIKQVLIADIVDVNEGKIAPYRNFNGRGRPVIPRYKNTSKDASPEKVEKKKETNDLNEKIKNFVNKIVIELIVYINEYIEQYIEQKIKELLK